MFKRLKQIRKDRNLTQREFSELLGTKRDAYASYETGRVVPSLSFVKLICSTFNVNEEWLLNGTEPIYNNNSGDNTLIEKISNEYNLDNFQKKLVQKYLELTEQQKNAVKSFLDKVYEEEFINPQSSENVSDEISVTEETTLQDETEEEFPPEYENMSIEEIEKQADFWDSLYEKRQAEIKSQKQEENSKDMA